jgi:hypothetical protein
MQTISTGIFLGGSGNEIHIQKMMTDGDSQTDFLLPDKRLKICFRHCTTRILSTGKRSSQVIILVDVSTILMATRRKVHLLMLSG